MNYPRSHSPQMVKIQMQNFWGPRLILFPIPHWSSVQKGKIWEFLEVVFQGISNVVCVCLRTCACLCVWGTEGGRRRSRWKDREGWNWGGLSVSRGRVCISFWEKWQHRRNILKVCEERRGLRYGEPTVSLIRDGLGWGQEAARPHGVHPQSPWDAAAYGTTHSISQYEALHVWVSNFHLDC